jgi:outer membrane protein TolC
MRIRFWSFAAPALVLFASRGALAADDAVPPPPTVADPMLTPVPDAGRILHDWREAVDMVRSRSIDLKSAALDVVRAEAQSRVALGGMLTQINGTGLLTHNFLTNTVPILTPVGIDTTTNPPTIQYKPIGYYTTPQENYVSGSIILQQPVVNLRALNAINTAKVRESIAGWTLEETKRQITLSVAQSIVNVVTAERVAELNRSGLRSALERLELTKQKQSLGAASGLDVVRAQQDVAAARATLVAGDETLRQSREALGLALGFPEAVSVQRGVSLNGLEDTARAICRPVKLEDRSDFQVARASIDAAEHQVKDVKTQFLPTISLQSTLGSTTADTGTAPNTTWNIQGVLSVPIWDGGMRYGNLRDANAQVDQASLKLESLRRTATVQLTQAERNVKVTDEKRKVAEEARDLSRTTDELTRKSYLEGRGTSLELVTAASALRDAEINLALAEFNLIQARLLFVLELAACDI